MVPIPTTPHNIRIRGYDHMLLTARALARRRNWCVAPLLSRRNNTTQHFAKSAAERRRQAVGFFEIQKKPEVDRTYLIIDDIYTTGSTIKAAADCLAQAGASAIWVAVVARQAGEKDTPTRDDTVRLG